MRIAVCGILAGICMAFSVHAADAPCGAATAACTEMLAIPGSQGRVLVYRTYPLDVQNALIKRGLIVIHGLGRDADSYFRSSLAATFLAGALGDTIVIVPRFASNEGGSCKDTLAAGEISWHCQPRFDSWRTGGPSPDNSTTSFDVVDELLRKLNRKDIFPNLGAIVVAGHSAGGQFVNRYEMSNTVHDKLDIKPTYVVANPSSYAYFDDLRPTVSALPSNVAALPPGYEPPLPSNPPPAFAPYFDRANCARYNTWPYGMNERKGYAAKLREEQLRKQLATRPTTYLLGELDILPLYGFDSSCAAMAQGGTRLARGFAYVKYVDERYGAKHRAVEVPACGHSARCMFTSEISLPLLFPKE
jgi:pimeloyl-ACP methyl ester carboxylesterase